MSDRYDKWKMIQYTQATILLRMEIDSQCSAGDYLSVTLQGIARIDASKLYLGVLDRGENPPTPPIQRWLLFFQIENMSSRTWDLNRHEWDLNDGTSTRTQTTELDYQLHQLPGEWEIYQLNIPPKDSIKTIFVYEDDIDGDSDWVLSYKKMVAEGWYDSIKQDGDVHIADFTDQHEEIELIVPADEREKLRWKNHIE